MVRGRWVALRSIGCLALVGCVGELTSGADGGSSMRDAGGPTTDAGTIDFGAPDSGPDDVPDAAGGDAGSGDAGADAGPVGCPAPAHVHYENWGDGDPWVVPSSGSAEIRIPLSNHSLTHYERMVVEWDMETNTTHGTFTQLFEVRNVAVPGGYGTTPTRYAALTTRNSVDFDTGMMTTWRDVIAQTTWGMCARFEQDAPSFRIRQNHRYHVRFVWNATTNMSSFTLTDEDGTVTMLTGDAASSIVPIGQGIHLLFGVSDRHGDWAGGMRPPWGWTFSNLVADLRPGGPHGPAAPRCDGSQAPGC